MATTYTRTFTTVLSLGQKLAEEKHLESARELMTELGKENEETMINAGVILKETNEAADLDTILFQWREIMPKLVSDQNIITEIIKQLKTPDGSEIKKEMMPKLR